MFPCPSSTNHLRGRALPGRSNGTCRAWALANVVGLAVVAWTAKAEGAPFELQWSAPPECPSGSAIVDATRARLGESGPAAPPELFVQGTVRARDGGFVATLVLSDASGQRVGERELRVAGQECAAVEEPVSLVLAMVIAALRPRDGEPADRREPAEAPPATRTQQRASLPAVPAESETRAGQSRLFFGLAGMSSVGVLPVFGLGGALRAMYSPGSSVYLGLDASFQVGGSVRVGTGETSFQLFDVGPRVGIQALGSRRFELIPTLGARAGVIHAPSSGFTRSFGNETRATFLAGLGLLGRFRLMSNLFFEALPEAHVVFVRDDFQSLDRGKLYSVHRAGPIDLRMSLGIACELF
ncbi:MAG: hypothetical protein BGO98_34995 [Myxococcales bacterium 68-20]|nr:hypothetical protein [Myxococcales bacterium]OJY22033.1 MAG: hypothetical protein BGO98_34995 [Myxococcales bacterium 68-20]